MAELILYQGPSGSGKTSSIRNLNPETTYIITPNTKGLSLPGASKNYQFGKNMLRTSEINHLAGCIQQISAAEHIKTLIIEDFTHFFSARIFSSAFLSQDSGNAAFQRWQEFGADVFQAMFSEADKLREDLDIVFLHHTELKDTGEIGFKSPGNLLDKAIDVPSYFTYIFHGVLQQEGDDTFYRMQTNKAAGRAAKTPVGSFPDLYIPNDLKAVLDRIADYKAGNIDPNDIQWK